MLILSQTTDLCAPTKKTESIVSGRAPSPSHKYRNHGPLLCTIFSPVYLLIANSFNFHYLRFNYTYIITTIYNPHIHLHSHRKQWHPNRNPTTTKNNPPNQPPSSPPSATSAAAPSSAASLPNTPAASVPPNRPKANETGTSTPSSSYAATPKPSSTCTTAWSAGCAARTPSSVSRASAGRRCTRR